MFVVPAARRKASRHTVRKSKKSSRGSLSLVPHPTKAPGIPHWARDWLALLKPFGGSWMRSVRAGQSCCSGPLHSNHQHYQHRRCCCCCCCWYCTCYSNRLHVQCVQLVCGRCCVVAMWGRGEDVVSLASHAFLRCLWGSVGKEGVPWSEGDCLFWVVLVEIGALCFTHVQA
jgi:hypothetical protein